MRWLPENPISLVYLSAFAAIVYLFLIALHRLIGKRTASQMNNFDWIVTVAMGAITGSTILSEGIALVEGLAAVTVLLFLQFCVTRASVQWRWFGEAVEARARLLYYSGEFLENSMKDERVTKREIRAAARGGGNRTMDDVAAVVLEADGTLSVLPLPDGDDTPVRPALLIDVEDDLDADDPA